jgi:anaerobic selenocysteine-containing dehydrogenase
VVPNDLPPNYLAALDGETMIDTLPVVHRTACNRDCGDACEMLVTVEGGQVTKLQGDPDHPVTRGFLCHRTSRFLERQYDPSRLTTPLMKVGGEFQAVTWDIALDRIAQTMLKIRDEGGGAALMHYRCGGSMGLMKHISDYFFEQFGPVTIKSGDVCTGAVEHAQMTDFGNFDSHDLFDLLNSKTIVLWGKNPFISQVHMIPVLKDAQKRGAKIVLIDPVHHQTTTIADHYLQPRPGGDIALALGTARVMFERDQHDQNARQFCNNFDEFHALAFSRELCEWSQLADVPVEQIELLAQLYSNRPASIVLGWGLQRRANGATSIRAIDALAAISGNMGIPGGGVSSYFKRRGAFDNSFIKGTAVAPRTIPEPLLGPGILATNDPPIRLLWVTAANPVVMLPESETVAAALKSTELTVVVDSFMTDSAKCADIVLPTTTMLEEDDLLGAYGHHWIASMTPAIPQPDGVKSDYEILQALAPRIGMSEINQGEFTQPVEWWKRRMLTPVSDQGASLEELKKGGVRSPIAPDLLYENQSYATPDGKASLLETANPNHDPTTADHPLLLMAMSSEKVQGSQWLPKDEESFAASVHPESAAGLAEGDFVQVESDRGAITVRLKFDPRQRRDIILMPKGGGFSKGLCANSLITAELTDAGECANYLDTPVRITPASLK